MSLPRVILLLAVLAGSVSADSGPWLSPAKFGHLAIAGSMTTVGAGAAHEVFRVDYHRAAWYGASAAVAAGGGKELYDWQFGETRRFDLRDIAVNIAGAGLGAASTELTAGGFPWSYPKTAGEVMAASSYVMLAGTLVTSVGVLPWLNEEQRQGWCLPVTLVGAGGALLCAASHLLRGPK